MMFQKGVLGVVVVIAAVMVTVLAGVLLNTEEVTAERQEFSYVTNVTGLFEHTAIDEYLDYNPVENWTGYRSVNGTPTSGIDYQTLGPGQANLYPVVTEYPGTSDTETLDSSITLQYGPLHDAQRAIMFYATNDAATDQTPTGWRGIAYPENSGPRFSAIQTLETIIGELTYDASTEYIDIDIYDSGVLFNRLGDWTMMPWTTPPSVTAYPNIVYEASLTAMTTDYDTLRISLSSGVVWAYKDGSTVWTSATSDVVGLIAPYHVTDDVLDTPSNQRAASVAYTTVLGSVTEYMDINEGVKLSDHNAIWNNNHRNDRISVLVRNDNEMYPHENIRMVWQMDLSEDGNRYFAGIRLTFYADRIEVHRTSHSGLDATLGPFRTVLVTADASEGTFTVQPVLDFVSFGDYKAVEDAGVTVPFYNVIQHGKWFQWVWFSEDDFFVQSPLRFGVMDTRVFMNTYNAVVTDETIRISEYFPDYDLYRIQFNSFGLVGNYIRMAYSSYPVIDGKVRITTGGIAHDLPINLLTVTFEKTDATHWRITASVPNSRPVLVQESTINDYIGFEGGYWLFSAGLYRGENVTVTENRIDLGGWAFDNDLAIVTFMGCLVLGTAVGTRIQTVGVTDMAVVGCAGLFGWILMGM